MKNWVKPYLKELMPDPVLRLSYEKSAGHFQTILPGFEYFWYDDAPCDELTYKVYNEITIISGITDPNSRSIREIKKDVFIIHYDFNYPQMVDAGLHLYEHTPEYLRWLLDRMIEEDFHAGIVLVEKRLAEIGATNEENRFEL